MKRKRGIALRNAVALVYVVNQVEIHIHFYGAGLEMQAGAEAQFWQPQRRIGLYTQNRLIRRVVDAIIYRSGSKMKAGNPKAAG